MKRLLAPLGAVVIGLSFQATHAATLTVNFASDGVILYDQTGLTALSGGLPTIDGDGFVLQLGYYDGATIGNNFSGNWVALTGEGSANTGGAIQNSSPTLTFNKTSIGDRKNEGASNGEFYLSVQFDTANANTSSNLPGSTSIPLSIRFYNASTLGAATRYNTISNDAWLWVTPFTPEPLPIDISLAASGAEWESTAVGQPVGNQGKTTLVFVPEPSSSLLLLAGLMGLAVNRRRRAA